MRSIIALVLGSALLLGAVRAQSLTRAEVAQQLAEAQSNGSAYITDSSYPVVDPRFMYNVKTSPLTSDYGGVPAGTQQSEGVPHGLPESHDNLHCVGPVSFCDIYAGS